MLPNLERRFEAIEQQRSALRGAVLTSSDTQMNWAPAATVWSMKQIIEHLVLSDETLGRAHDAGRVPTEALMFRVIPRAWRRALILRALKRNAVLPLPSPGVEPQGKVSLSELLSRWDAARAGMRRTLDTLDSRERRYAHPVLGPLTAAQMLVLSQEHTAYHTRQLEALKHDTAFPRGA